jgi:hypothetical protein
MLSPEFRSDMQRRVFITLLGGAAAWPLAARTQQPDVRTIGVLSPFAEDDPDAQANLMAFRQALQKLGWAGPTVATSASTIAGAVRTLGASAPMRKSL